MNRKLMLFFYTVYTGLLSQATGATNLYSLEQELPFKKIIFTVLDIKTKKPLATGFETISIQSGQITKNTEYYSVPPKRSLIQSELAVSDLKTLTLQQYRFNNIQTGENVELAMATPPTARLVYKSSSVSKPENFEYQWTSRTIVGKTLHHFIVRNWINLLDGKSPEFDLFVPMKRDHFKFRVRHDREAAFQSAPLSVISLEPSNWAIRALVPRMEFFYALKNGLPVLKRYEGRTTVTIDGDDQREVAIEFDYET
jgi:hypothetical protein